MFSHNTRLSLSPGLISSFTIALKTVIKHAIGIMPRVHYFIYAPTLDALNIECNMLRHPFWP